MVGLDSYNVAVGVDGNKPCGSGMIKLKLGVLGRGGSVMKLLLALAAGMAIGLEQEAIGMAQEAAGWCPPREVQDLLVASIPDGTQWYECRMALKVLSYPVERYDDALKDAKALKRVFKAELYHCHKENGRLEAQRVW